MIMLARNRRYAAITADVLSARAAAKAFVSDTGRYIRGNLDTVVCPVALEALFAA